MSRASRYASITSNLLVRKGDAKPWQMPGSEISDLRRILPTHHFAATADDEHYAEEERKAAHVAEEKRTSAQDYRNWRREHEPAPQRAVQDQGEQASHFHHEHAHDEHTKRCTLRLTPAEYERLGIIGVKREMTRQQILRHAIDCYLAQAKQEYQRACGCLAGEECRDC